MHARKRSLRISARSVLAASWKNSGDRPIVTDSRQSETIEESITSPCLDRAAALAEVSIKFDYHLAMLQGAATRDWGDALIATRGRAPIRAIAGKSF
jgi:hypothetical protein